MKITLAIGSNILQQKNIDEAQSRLRHLLPGIVFGEAVWTTPIGIQSDRFLNLLAYADTPLSLDHLQEALKAIEREMGDSHENHQQGHVIIDLDVAEYDGRIVKEVVWIKEVQQAQQTSCLQCWQTSADAQQLAIRTNRSNKQTEIKKTNS